MKLNSPIRQVNILLYTPTQIIVDLERVPADGTLLSALNSIDSKLQTPLQHDLPYGISNKYRVAQRSCLLGFVM